MSDSALEAVLRRDRAIMIAALSVLTVLAWADLVWLADDMAMGGMDMTGFRMIPAGQGLMMPASEPWKPIEFGYMFAMWAVMMIGMMTPSVAPMILIYARVGRQAADGRQAVRRNCVVRRRLFAGMDSLLTCGDLGAMGARTCNVTYADDGECEQYSWWRGFNRRRPLSVDAAQGGVLVPLPSRRSHSSCATAASAVIRPAL